jgi:hypothetical protein
MRNLRNKWLPVLKSGNATEEQIKEFKREAELYKNINVRWRYNLEYKYDRDVQS